MFNEFNADRILNSIITVYLNNSTRNSSVNVQMHFARTMMTIEYSKYNQMNRSSFLNLQDIITDVTTDV